MGSGVGLSVGVGVGGWVPTDYETGGWGWLGNEVKTVGDRIKPAQCGHMATI